MQTNKNTLNNIFFSESQAKDTFKVAYEAMDIPSMKGKFKVTKEIVTNHATKSELKY